VEKNGKEIFLSLNILIVRSNFYGPLCRGNGADFNREKIAKKC
jgi:hypothetical protein